LEASYAAIHKRVPIAHVEAGLRTGNRHAPFPEEINRSMIARLADWHFAPTSAQGETLRDENISADSIFVCGNTVVDALEWMQDKLRCRELPSGIANGTRKLVLATCHRRENFGIPMRSIALAIKHLADGHPDTHFILPMHPHPAVREAIVPILKKQNGVTLCEPLDYPEFLSALQQAYLVLTDSGGVQEEACTLGKPLLILRNEPERTEGIDVGNQRLVGTLVQDILEESHELLVNEDACRAMKIPSNIYGDGHASERIACILEEKIQSPNRIASFRKEGRTELTLLH
jgi:UDP-N-acetylglucosamine 2-epimerase (non-hydrolysing)